MEANDRITVDRTPFWRQRGVCESQHSRPSQSGISIRKDCFFAILVAGRRCRHAWAWVGDDFFKSIPKPFEIGKNRRAFGVRRFDAAFLNLPKNEKRPAASNRRTPRW